MKILRPLFRYGLICTCVLGMCSVFHAQTPNSTSDIQALPPVESLQSITRFAEFKKQIDKIEKTALKTSGQDTRAYCDTVSIFVKYRFDLHRAAVDLSTDQKFADPVKQAEYREAFAQNVSRAKGLYSEAEEKCSAEKDPSEKFLTAKFANAWLLDNVPSSLALAANEKEKSEEIAEIWRDYETVLTQFRTRSDKSWIDPVFLLYTYANSLLRRGEIEQAGPLLTECLQIASPKYGSDSRMLLPILKLSSGTAYASGDDPEYKRLSEWTKKIAGTSVVDLVQLFDLRKRIESESKLGLYLDKPITIHDRKIEDANQTETVVSRAGDLPRPLGQGGLLDTRIAGGGPVSATFPFRVYITVNESGTVTDADVRDNDESTRAKLKEIAMGLKFRPLIYKGRPCPMKGYVSLYAHVIFKWKK